MPSHSEGPGTWLSVWRFLLIHCLYKRAAKVLARLRGCAGSPEPSLLAQAISTKFAWRGPIVLTCIICGLIFWAVTVIKFISQMCLTNYIVILICDLSAILCSNLKHYFDKYSMLFTNKIFTSIFKYDLSSWFEPRHEKTCFCPMRTKVQISLPIHAVCSAPLLFSA